MYARGRKGNGFGLVEQEGVKKETWQLQAGGLKFIHSRSKAFLALPHRKHRLGGWKGRATSMVKSPTSSTFNPRLGWTNKFSIHWKNLPRGTGAHSPRIRGWWIIVDNDGDIVPEFCQSSRSLLGSSEWQGSDRGAANKRGHTVRSLSKSLILAVFGFLPPYTGCVVL